MYSLAKPLKFNQHCFSLCFSFCGLLRTLTDNNLLFSNLLHDQCAHVSKFDFVGDVGYVQAGVSTEEKRSNYRNQGHRKVPIRRTILC